MAPVMTLHHGDCIEVMRTMPDASVDSIVTDPPYGLGFMGKAWDELPPGEEWARECLRVLKPGGYLLAFGGTRTWHRLAVAVEDAGFEIRDSIAWMYGSGFPKSLDVSKAIDKGKRRDYVAAALRLGMVVPGRNVDDWTKEDHSPGDKWWGEFKAHLSPAEWGAIEREVVGRGASGAAAVAYARDAAGEYEVTAPATDDARTWQGWGTALKPAFEPIVVARKPLVGTVAANVLAHGTGALNVDGCRVATPDGRPAWDYPNGAGGHSFKWNETENHGAKTGPAGRWPANVVLDESQAEALDEQSGVLTSGKLEAHHQRHTAGGNGATHGAMQGVIGQSFGDTGGASRFFYVAKASRNERPNVDGTAHPTVKPLALMRWLVRLVTPPGGTVIDPFAGSGTTIEAALLEGLQPIGIEREADYLPLIEARVARVTDVPMEMPA